MSSLRSSRGAVFLWCCALAWSWAFPAGAAISPLRPGDPLCAAPVTGDGRQGPDTLKMVALLRDLERTADPRESPYLNVRLVDLLRQARVGATNLQDLTGINIQLCLQLNRAGRTLESIQEFNQLPGFFTSNKVNLNSRDRFYLRFEQGMAFLRLGEQENCLLDHTSESCLLPIQPGGYHREQRGSRGAISIFESMLKVRTNDLRLRWLLNIAHMTVGEYPDKVAPEWLIPPKVFAAEYPLPKFPEAAGAAGLDVDDLAGGCITDDFDGDGFLDVMASSWGLSGQIRFFHNNGDGSFTERTREAGLTGLTGSLNIQQTDYNNDGHLDVFMLRGAWLGKAGAHPNSLLRNNGDGTFEDVTEQAGLLSFHPTQAATWFDFNGDGWLDLFIGNESTANNSHPCELYRNNGNGTFTECAAASGAGLIGFVKGVASGDFNNDGRPDLYVSCRDQYNVLLRNDGPRPDRPGAWKFTDVTQSAGVGAPVASFPTWFFDYDNDGWEDIFVTGYAATVSEIAADYLGLPHQGERARLYHNNQDGTFSDVTKAAGLYRVLHAMGANYGDFDNDGWLDFYVGTGDPDFATLIPNRAFRNNGGKNFQEVTAAGGFGHLQKGHAVAFADLDNDGQQDIYAVMGGAYAGDNYRNALFVNPGNSNRWLTLKLEGRRSNRAALGARLQVNVLTASGPRSIYKTVSSGGSFGSSPLRQEIGLGDARSIESVRIQWPTTGQVQTLTNLALNSFYRVIEGTNEAERLTYRPFRLATKIDPTRPAGHKHVELQRAKP